jgi:hypothetical protein
MERAVCKGMLSMGEITTRCYGSVVLVVLAEEQEEQ